MPRKYQRKVHVLRAHTSDGRRYVGVVRYDGITVTGVRFILTARGLWQVKWPRTRPVQVTVARGVTRHVIEAFKRYLEGHPWALESASDAEREAAVAQVSQLEYQERYGRPIPAGWERKKGYWWRDGCMVQYGPDGQVCGSL